MGRISANSVSATPSCRLKSIRLTAIPLLVGKRHDAARIGSNYFGHSLLIIGANLAPLKGG
jgi:hypothetical protein